MRSVVRFLFPALLAFLSWALPAGGRVVRVRDVATLQAAVLQAQPGDTIQLRRGVYRLTGPLVAEGKSDLTLMARPGHKVEISGGVRLPRGRFKRAKGFAKGVRCIDVSALGVTGPRTNGHAHPSIPAWSVLSADGSPLRLSSWPNGGWFPLDSIVQTGISIRFDGSDAASTVAPSADVSLLKKGSSGVETVYGGPAPGFGIIAFRGDRPFAWADPTKGFLNGCFRYGWAEEMIPIKEIGPGGTIEVADTTYYGFGRKPGEAFQKWRVLNIPEEVDEPGEYAIDAAAGRIWVMLPRKARRLELSLMEEPLLVLRDCRNVTVAGLDFACSRSDGVSVTASEAVRLKDCTLHNLGHQAAVIDDACQRCGLAACRIYDIGAGGVTLLGGDRKAIVRGDNYVENCTLHDFNRIEKSNRPGVRMHGLGNRVSHCEIYNSATQAILMLGNDQTVEHCDIHDVCQDVEDCGAIYYGRDPTYRGSVVRWNYFHDIDVPWNVRAIYHDDGACACEVYGNIFNRISSPPIQIGGGSDIVYHDNIFMHLDCAAIKIDARLKTWGADRLPFHDERIAELDGPAFRARYPEFESYLAGNRAEPTRNVLERNVFYDVKWAFEAVVWADHDYNDVIEGTANFFSVMHDNWKTATNPGFTDPDDPLAGFVPAPAVLDSIPGFQLPPRQ